MTSILVLEDSVERVRALKRAFPDADITHVTDVQPFLMLHDGGDYDLIVMDHDLGHAGDDGLLSRDSCGLTGSDAVRDFRRDVATPVLVWSVNPVRAPQMMQDLRRKGVWAMWWPFADDTSMWSIVRNILIGRSGNKR